MKRIFTLFVLALFLGTGSVMADADLTIRNVSEWKTFCSNVNNGTDYRDRTIYLTTNITLTDGAWTPIGTSVNRFSGHFEGWGHTISGLSIDAGSSDYQGLFGYVDGRC